MCNVLRVLRVNKLGRAPIASAFRNGNLS